MSMPTLQDSSYWVQMMFSSYLQDKLLNCLGENWLEHLLVCFLFFYYNNVIMQLLFFGNNSITS